MVERKTGIGSHQSHKMITDEWLTPPNIIKALGRFDLDPCSPVNRPWNTADFHYDKVTDGLIRPWAGRVWLNPPYGKMAENWLKKLAIHGNGIALIFARTETKMFFDYVWDKADGLLFLRGRIYFHNVNGQVAKTNSGAPSVLIAYGKENAIVLRDCILEGRYVQLNGRKQPRQHQLELF